MDIDKIVAQLNELTTQVKKYVQNDKLLESPSNVEKRLSVIPSPTQFEVCNNIKITYGWNAKINVQPEGSLWRYEYVMTYEKNTWCEVILANDFRESYNTFNARMRDLIFNSSVTFDDMYSWVRSIGYNDGKKYVDFIDWNKLTGFILSGNDVKNYVRLSNDDAFKRLAFILLKSPHNIKDVVNGFRQCILIDGVKMDHTNITKLGDKVHMCTIDHRGVKVSSCGSTSFFAHYNTKVKWVEKYVSICEEKVDAIVPDEKDKEYHVSYKNDLQEFCTLKGLGTVRYRHPIKQGSDHKPEYSTRAYLLGSNISTPGVGIGRS
jgi:hypothetical protein